MEMPFFFLLLLAWRVDMMGGAPAASLGHGRVVSMETRVEGGGDRSPVSTKFPAPSLLPPTTLFYECLVLSLS